jgi:hypothetical protein
VQVQEHDVALKRLRVTAPLTARYIEKLYKTYRVEQLRYTGNKSLQQYMIKTHDDTATNYHRCRKGIPRGRLLMYEYALRRYSEKYNLDINWFIKMTTHEYGFVNWYTTKTSKGYLLPIERWSWGPWQVQKGTLVGTLESLGCKDAKNLSYGDMLTFPLLNADVSARVLAYHIRCLGSYEKGLQAYNGGPVGWKDGRSLKYLKRVRAVDLTDIAGLK